MTRSSLMAIPRMLLGLLLVLTCGCSRAPKSEGPELKRARSFEILREQFEGPNERSFKRRVVPILERNGVARAYLLRVRSEQEEVVAIGLVGGDREKLIEEVGALVKLTVHGDFLDIFFLTDAREEQASRVAKPFYVAAEANPVQPLP